MCSPNMKVHLTYFSGICLHLFAISISADQCLDGPSGTNCTFHFDLCAWKSKRWKQLSDEWKAALDTDKNHRGSMKSKELCSTNTDTHCLLFEYEFRYQRYNETTLSVLLHEDDTAKKTIWRSRSFDDEIYPAKVPLSTNSSFKIELKVHRHGTTVGVGSFVMIDKIWYNSSKCELDPEDADPGRKIKLTKPFTEKPKVTKTTAKTTTKLTKPPTIKPTPGIIRTTATTTTTTTTTRASPTSTKTSITSSRTTEQKTHIMTVSETMTSSTTSEKTSKSQQRSTSPNPLKGSGPTLSTPDSAKSSNGYTVGTAVSIFVLVVCIVFIIALLRHRRKACWQRSDADKTTATNVSLLNAESHLLTDSRADGTQGGGPPNLDTNTYSVVDDEQTNPSNNGKPTSPLQPQTDVYSVVHKPGKGGKSRHQSFNTADDNSKTTNNGAAAANNEDYNTLNMRGGETMGNNTKPGCGESAGAVYSHLASINKTAAVPAIKYPSNADTSQASGNDVDTANNSGAGIYHILEESEEDTTAKPRKMNEQGEEYGSLDFAGRKGGAASEAVCGEGEGEQVYNRLNDGDGETYSHVKRDVKQQVVSDDTYSHIV